MSNLEMRNLKHTGIWHTRHFSTGSHWASIPGSFAWEATLSTLHQGSLGSWETAPLSAPLFTDKSPEPASTLPFILAVWFAPLTSQALMTFSLYSKPISHQGWQLWNSWLSGSHLLFPHISYQCLDSFSYCIIQPLAHYHSQTLSGSLVPSEQTYIEQDLHDLTPAILFSYTFCSTEKEHIPRPDITTLYFSAQPYFAQLVLVWGSLPQPSPISAIAICSS